MSGRYCPSKRIKITDAQASDRKAPCPRCGRVLRIVPNFATLETTLAQHLPALDQPGPTVK